MIAVNFFIQNVLFDIGQDESLSLTNRTLLLTQYITFVKLSGNLNQKQNLVE